MTRGRKILLFALGTLFVLGMVVLLGVMLIVSAVRDSAPVIANNSVLVLQVGGSLPDFVAEDPLRELAFGGREQSLTNLLTEIRKAKVDKRINAILLDVNLTSAGWGKADEIRDAIIDFRQSGKPVYAFMEYGTNKEYYIATAADKIYVAPIGDLFINGLAAEAMFFRGSLDKLGVEPDFYQIGKYKSAPDQFTRKDMSPAHREQLDALLDDIFNRFVAEIADKRKKSVEDVRVLIDNAPLSAGEAKNAGLIDDALYRDQVEGELKKRLGYKEDETLKLVRSEYRQVSPDSVGLNNGDKAIAVIYASGGIGGGQSKDSPTGGQSVGSDTVVKAINNARENKNVRAIVLRVDSPGGTSYASDVIWRAVELARAKKPVVVSMSDVAASGGYYIATNANKIVAEPLTITGSIGVFAGKPVLKGFYDWTGVNAEYLLRGKNAGLFRETEPFTPDERKKFQSMLDDFYWNEFLPKVAQGRKRDREYIHSIAQGRVWSGVRAKEVGLVDEFGGLERAIQIAKELAKIPADEQVRRVVYPAPRTTLEKLFGGGREDEVQISAAEQRRIEQQRAIYDSLPEDMQRTFRYISLFERMKRGETMALMPLEVTIK